MFWSLICYVFVVVFFIKKLSRVVSFFIQKQRRSNFVVSGIADDMIFFTSGKTSEKFKTKNSSRNLLFKWKGKYKYVLYFAPYL